MRYPILTLTTDFGLSDHYVGAMKGVILGICPNARIVDISHEIAPYEITEGAYTIAQAYRTFPKKTVHVVVVDPGVGTARRPILLEAAGQYFIAPDNGVLAMIYGREKSKVRLMSNDRYFRKPVSQTFHGRDIFAPVAGALASGAVRAEEVGPALHEVKHLTGLHPERVDKNTWRGMILSVDHFGNVITNFSVSAFPQIANRAFALEAADQKITEFRRTFGDAPQDLCFAYSGSGGYIELGMNQRSAAAFLGVRAGQRLMLRVTIV